MASALVGLAHSVGTRTIAEGVETQAQFVHLREAGYDFAQGYYFAKPLPSQAVGALIVERPRW